MEKLVRFLSVIGLPLGVFNALGGIVAGIWLAVLGEWRALGIGCLALVLSGMGLGNAMMPGRLFAGPAAFFLEKRNKVLGYIFGILGNLYSLLVVLAWCLFVLVAFLKRSDASSEIPMLIWSYGVATGGVTWLGHKDLQAGNHHGMMTAFFVQIAYVSSILGIVFASITVLDVVVIFAVLLLIGEMLQFWMVLKNDRQAEFS